MILDAKLEMSDGQALGAISATSSVVSTNAIDLGANGKDGWGVAKTMDIGEGGTLSWVVQVAVALVGASASLSVTLVTKAADKSVSSAGTTVATLTIAALAAAGTKASVKVPSGAIQRYVGTLYTAVTGSLTSATMDSFLTWSQQT